MNTDKDHGADKQNLEKERGKIAENNFFGIRFKTKLQKSNSYVCFIVYAIIPAKCLFLF